MAYRFGGDGRCERIASRAASATLTATDWTRPCLGARPLSSWLIQGSPSMKLHPCLRLCLPSSLVWRPQPGKVHKAPKRPQSRIAGLFRGTPDAKCNHRQAWAGRRDGGMGGGWRANRAGRRARAGVEEVLEGPLPPSCPLLPPPLPYPLPTHKSLQRPRRGHCKRGRPGLIGHP